jgi:hypothetical protein
MSPYILTREELGRMLKAWETGRVSSAEVLKWADAVYGSDHIDYEDWEGDDSVTKEVLASLNLLDMNLAVPADAPIYLDFLATPRGEFPSGYVRYKEGLDGIDYPARRQQLKDDPLYAQFLQNQKE